MADSASGVARAMGFVRTRRIGIMETVGTRLETTVFCMETVGTIKNQSEIKHIHIIFSLLTVSTVSTFFATVSRSGSMVSTEVF